MKLSKLLEELTLASKDYGDVDVTVVFESGDYTKIEEVVHNSHSGDLDLLTYDRFKNLYT